MILHRRVCWMLQERGIKCDEGYELLGNTFEMPSS